MFIEDEELRGLYRAASAEHIETLEAGLLHLEKHPDDRQQLQALLRAAHSLKGDSRMLGVEEAETLVHQMEDLLSAVEQGEQALTAELCDRIYVGLDAVRKIAHTAVTGEETDVSVFHVLAQLMTSADEGTPVQPALESEETLPQGDLAVLQVTEDTDEALAAELHQLLEQSPPERMVTAQSTVSETPVASTYQIDTVRVEATKLDQLITQASELAVTKLRISQRIGDVGQLLSLREQWAADLLAHQLSLDTLKKQLSSAHTALVDQFFQLNQRRLTELSLQIEHLQTQVGEDSARLDITANQLETGIRNLRMLPIAGLFQLFPRMVRDLAKQQQKQIELILEGTNTLADKHILEQMQAPLTHLVRNAIDHGIESPAERRAMGKLDTATLRLRAYQLGSSIAIELSDDGRGLELAKIQETALRRGLHTEAELARMTTSQIQSLIFAPGFSTRTQVTEISGRGVGLDVVRANMERLQGTIQVRSIPSQGCTFQLTLSSSLTTTAVLIVEVNGHPYAIPLEFVDKMISVDRQQIFAMEGHPTITDQDQPLSVMWLSDLLALPVASPHSSSTAAAVAATIPCVILQIGSERLGLFVDRLLDQQDIVLKPQSKLLQRIQNVSGATILGNGDICMVLNPQDFLQREKNRPSVHLSEVPAAPKVLLVEDSIPIRTQVKRILEGAGYDVTAAVDGQDGFNQLQNGRFDAVVSDVEMPNLSGLEMTAQIRQYPEYQALPIVLVTTLAKEEDQRRGAEAGANAYLTKGDFDQTLLIDTLRRFI